MSRAFMVVALIAEATWLAVIGEWFAVPILTVSAAMIAYSLGHDHGRDAHSPAADDSRQ